MPTIADTLKQASHHLRQSEVPNDLLDAQTLLAHALGKDRTYLIIHFNETLSDELRAAYQALIERRATGEPLQYIVGHQQFYGLEFEVTPDVLIPRPETELIVEETLRLAANSAQPVIIDVGTGSGCLAVTLARELEDAQVIATDISPAALAVARRNAERNGVQDRIVFVEGDLLSGVTTTADFIVSNPPYVAAHELPTLQREVRDWEPKIALTDFADGLEFYRRLLREAPAHLKPNGCLLMEMGYQQSETIKALVDRDVWSEPRALQDLQRIERTLVLARR
ncbi:MAG TPA: peptide chain release factor N(5)-glutamine methyltransferase [Blastocatellia bacterium]|nr:peptide chain release factor N(5)-glutamine methyltransferase [Blastocatellia bacterium]